MSNIFDVTFELFKNRILSVNNPDDITGILLDAHKCPFISKNDFTRLYFIGNDKAQTF